MVMLGRGGMQNPAAHILPPHFTTGEGFQNEDEAMPETHTPQVGALVVPSSHVVSTSESSVSHLRVAWTHSPNERLELISRNIPQMQVEWHTMEPSQEEPHVQMTPEAYEHYEQEIVGALVATGETGEVALFDRESTDPVPRTLALHEDAIGALWNYTEWIRKQCENGFNQNLISHRRVSELLCLVGQCYESLKEHLPHFEQQRAEWLLDQLTKIQQWMENFKGEVVREVLSLENRVSEFQKRQEQALTMSLQHSPESQTDSANLHALRLTLQSLQDHMTVFESQMAEMKFSVNTNLRAADIKLEACLAENAQLRVLVQTHEQQFAELLPFLSRIETRFMEINEQLVRLESQTVSEVAERSEAVNQLKHALQNVKRGMEFMAVDVENAVSQHKSQAADNYDTNRRTFYTQTVSRETVDPEGSFSENSETQFAFDENFRKSAALPVFPNTTQNPPSREPGNWHFPKDDVWTQVTRNEFSQSRVLPQPEKTSIIDVDELPEPSKKPPLGMFFTPQNPVSLPRVLPCPLSSAPVMPVSAVAATPGLDMGNVALAGNPMTIVMAKHAVAPKFSGKAQDWVYFKNDWRKYVRLMGGEGYTDLTLLNTLESTLNAAHQANCNRRIGNGELTTFAQLWEELEAEYGVDRGVSNKQIWQEVTLNYEGQLTWNAFYEFWEHFLTLKENVEDATEEDSYYILIKQIPEPLRKRVVEHQTRVLAERYRLSMSGLPKMTLPDLKKWLAKLHITTQHVKILPDQVILDVKGEIAAATNFGVAWMSGGG